MVRSTVQQTGINVKANTLTGPGGATIPASNIKVTRESNVVAGSWGNNIQSPPDGSMNYLDPLLDNTASTLSESKPGIVSSSYTSTGDGWYPQGAVDGFTSTTSTTSMCNINFMGWTSNTNAQSGNKWILSTREKINREINKCKI